MGSALLQRSQCFELDEPSEVDGTTVESQFLPLILSAAGLNAGAAGFITSLVDVSVELSERVEFPAEAPGARAWSCLPGFDCFFRRLTLDSQAAVASAFVRWRLI